MLAKLSDLVQALLADRVFKDDNEIYKYYILMSAVAFGTLAYLGLLLIFVIRGMLVMSIINAVSLLLMWPMYRMVRVTHRFNLMGTLFSLMVTCTATVHILLLGFHLYLVFYYVLIVILQFIVSYGGFRIRGVVLSVLLICLVGTTVLGFTDYVPVYDIGWMGLPLALYNIMVGLVGGCVELTLVATVRKVIARYNEKRLDEMTDRANSDPLTGLHNRRYAYQFFETLKSGHAGERWCIAMMDIDNFKGLNDDYGHATGDRVLAGIANLLRKKLRKSDLVIRWGGEEFLLVLQGTPLSDARGVLEGLRKAVEEMQIESGGRQLSVTATIGAAELNLEDIERSVHQCDQKMYQGKSNGKNTVVI